MRKAVIFFGAAVTTILQALPISAAFAEQSVKDKIVGTWKAVSWETRRPSGQIVNIWMGPHPTGLIIYQPNGYMAVQLMADPRPKFTQNPGTSPAPYDEFRTAYFGYYGYWGTYTTDDANTAVVHNIEGSERPGEVGRKYSRSVSINGKNLVLTTPPYKAAVASLPHDALESMQITADEELVNILTFERID